MEISQNTTKELVDVDRTTENCPIRPTVESYGQLETAFDYFDHHLFFKTFDTHLPHVMFTMPKSHRFMGYFSHLNWNKDNTEHTTTSEIALNPYFFNNPTEVFQTLCHEMVHLAQAEFPDTFGKSGKRGYHNKAFATTMVAIGLMPSSTGKPGGKSTGTRMSDYVIGGGLFEFHCNNFLELGNGHFWSTKPNSYSHSEEQESVVDSVRDQKRRSKTKFTCSVCSLNAWAKPNAQLVCGTCTTRMLAVQS